MQETCTIQSAGCICRTLDGICGACIENRDRAGGPDECCSLEYCPQDGRCGECPAQTCDGGCTTESECSQRGGASCHCVGGACQTAVAPIAPIVAGCPPGYTGNAQSPCDRSCPCRGGRRCHNGRCCEPKGTHCKHGNDCCSGKCKRQHANHKQCA